MGWAEKANKRSEWYRTRHPEEKVVFEQKTTPVKTVGRQKGFIRKIIDKILDL